MTAPVVTPDMAAWASAFVESVRYVRSHDGQPWDEAKVTAAIRSALTEPRWDGRPDVDPDVDDGPSGWVADEEADVLEARETRAREWQA